MGDEVLKCEKLLHGHREGKKIVDKQTGEVKRVGESTNHPYRCDRLAKRYEVRGYSFTAYTQLCKMHKACAEREGFTMVEA